MFDACTKTERMGVARLAAVVALAGVVFAAQAALFEGVIARPLAGALPAIAKMTYREPARDDLPEFTETILVTAPYRMRRATEAHLTPWQHPAPVSIALNGYCIVEH
jgi:hypothetical protein